MQKFFLEGDTVETIYFGGGTPSLLNIEDVNRICDEINKHYLLADKAEITLEANPDDINKRKLLEYKNSFVNRLSIGVQSFYDKDLRYLNRIHNSRQAYDAVEEAMKSGFENISVDLIYGIPGQSKTMWINNIKTLLEMNIPHISAYSITIEPDTALQRNIAKKRVSPPEESLSIEHFMELVRIMDDNKYIHYEISNFAREGYFSRHNNNYWSGVRYLGLGPSAHSYDGNNRQWNVSNVSKYIEGLNKKIIPCEKETLSVKQKFNEYLMISLRTLKGCNLSHISEKYGHDYYSHCLQTVKPWQESGYVRINDDVMILSTKGKLFADRIASEMFID